MNYITYQQKDCFTGCIVNAVRALGKNCTEAEILLKGDGFTIRYKPTVIDGTPRFLLITELREACIKYLNDNNIIYKEFCGETLDRARKIVKEAIDLGNIPLVQIAANSIHYHPVFNQTTNSLHCLNILAVDEDRNIAVVSDGYVPTTPVLTYDGEMPISDLEDGYERSERHIFVFSQVKDHNIDDGEECVSRFEISKIKRVLTEYMSGGEKEGVFYGISAVKKVFESLECVMDWPKDEFRNKIMDFNNIYKTWGFISAKRIMAELFDECECLKQFAEEMDNIAEAWNGLSRMMVKMAIAYRPSSLLSIKEKVLELTEKEKELFSAVIGVIEREENK